MFSSGSRDLLCSSPPLLLWSWVFIVLVSLGLVSLPCPLSLGQGQWSVSRLPAVSMLWWFADCFSILQSCLTLHVAHWLRKWATYPISGSVLSLARCRPFCLSSLCLLKVCMEINSLPLPPSPVGLQHPTPFAVCSFSVHCLLFSFFLWGGHQSAQGGNDAWCSPVGLLNVYQAGWSWYLAEWEPSCFLSVMWHEKASFGLGV
jgi:hypothetical protein